MQRDYVPRMINLERSDYLIVKRMAVERGLGDKGFSAALRMIIREWQDYQIQDPTLMSTEDFRQYLVDLGVMDQPATE